MENENIKPVNLHNFFMDGPITAFGLSDDNNSVFLEVKKLGLYVDVELPKCQHDSIDINNIGCIHILSSNFNGSPSQYKKVNSINIHYDTEENLKKFCAHIKELQPKAEKLTRKELIILDRVFEDHYLRYGRAEDGLIYAIGICSEKLVDEIFEHYSVVEDPNVYLQYIAADKEDLKVLTHINKALNNEQ